MARLPLSTFWLLCSQAALINMQVDVAAPKLKRFRHSAEAPPCFLPPGRQHAPQRARYYQKRKDHHVDRLRLDSPPPRARHASPTIEGRSDECGGGGVVSHTAVCCASSSHVVQALCGFASHPSPYGVGGLQARRRKGLALQHCSAMAFPCLRRDSFCNSIAQVSFELKNRRRP